MRHSRASTQDSPLINIIINILNLLIEEPPKAQTNLKRFKLESLKTTLVDNFYFYALSYYSLYYRETGGFVKDPVVGYVAPALRVMVASVEMSCTKYHGPLALQ